MHRLSFLYMQSRGRCVACLFSPVTRLRTANTVSYRGCGILVRFKSRLHCSATIKQRQESIHKEIAKKLDEDQNNHEIKNILQLTKMQQIEIETAVEAGHLLKEVTVQAAKNFDATCVILNRKLRKDEKYIMDYLTCGIIRLKHDGDVEYVRAPKAAEDIPPDTGGEY